MKKNSAYESNTQLHGEGYTYLYLYLNNSNNQSINQFDWLIKTKETMVLKCGQKRCAQQDHLPFISG